MRPACLLFAMAAVAAAHPLQASTEIEVFNQLKHSGQLDALIEQAFQDLIDASDDVDKSVKEHIVDAGKAVKKFADECGITDAIKEIAKHCLGVAKDAVKEAATDVIKTNIAHGAEKLKPTKKTREIDELNEMIEQAAQEWVDKQDAITISNIMRGVLKINELD
ncbi:hypothetical protein ONZ45_g2422 [Pleurotus djamor]|nr:hypothetical protein ONZ45_g2422 [Pleurotus djamor]